MSTSETPRYERLFENTIVPMMMLDLKSGSILDANEAAAEFYGYGRSDMQGMAVSTIETMPPEEIKALMQRQLSEMKEIRRVLTHRMADGTIRDVAASVGIMPDADGPIAFVIIFDVTAWRSAIGELDEHRERLDAFLQEAAEDDTSG